MASLYALIDTTMFLVLISNSTGRYLCKLILKYKRPPFYRALSAEVFFWFCIYWIEILDNRYSENSSTNEYHQNISQHKFEVEIRELITAVLEDLYKSKHFYIKKGIRIIYSIINNFR